MAFACTPDLFGVIKDAIEGPSKAEVLVANYDVDKPTGRYSRFRTAEVLIDFQTVDGRMIPIMVKEHDSSYILEILGSPYSFKNIEYYPNSHVLVSSDDGWFKGFG